MKGLPKVQLYDLSADRAEQHNVQAEHAEIVERLTRLLSNTWPTGEARPA